MKKIALILNILVINSFFMAIGARGVMAAPHLIANPSSGSYNVDNTFTVTIKADSVAEIISGVDGVGTYDSAKLELVSAVKSSPMVFDAVDGGGNCSAIDTAEAGKFSFSCYSNNSLENKAINGDLVVLTFKAKAVGTAVIAFTCTSGSTVDSNIVKSLASTDVIVCGENVGGSYTITAATGGATISTPTPTPTNAPASSPLTTTTTTTTRAATELPKTGAIGSTVGLIVFGAVSLLSALFLKFL